jgi:transcription initiation factor TFIIB
VTDARSGEVVCGTCGLVLTDQMTDPTPEWRAFTLAERMAKSRTGSPTSLRLFDKGLATTFHPDRDASGRSLSTNQRATMLRLRKWQSRARARSYVLYNLSLAMTELSHLADSLHIPKGVLEEAALIYRKTLDKGLVRGRSIQGMAAASLYAACRLTRIPRNLNTIVSASSKNRREIARSYRLIQRELNLHMPIDNPSKYIPKLASGAGLSQHTENLAIELLHKAKELKVGVGKCPTGIAAAALYRAANLSGEKVTQKELAELAEVTEVTVRNRHKKLVKDLQRASVSPSFDG